MVRTRLILALMTAAAFAVAAPSALADVVSSSNWAGYAVHRAGIRFTRVLASWTQPTAQCTTGHRTYSALWVGLGGYNASSNSLEQIGTEVDCTVFGRVSSSAWYELVPAPSRAISMKVSPGDQMLATVTVTGNRVILALRDVTTHRSFTRTFRPSSIDVSSAEWILEAPSECTSNTTCRTLPLANFGSASFGSAQAEAVGGHTGAIADSFWDWTQIKLNPGDRRFITYSGNGSGAAVPSALSAEGNSFSVAYSTVVQQAGRIANAVTAAVPRAGYIVHPGR
jgi:Peptidase A4 family